MENVGTNVAKCRYQSGTDLPKVATDVVQLGPYIWVWLKNVGSDIIQHGDHAVEAWQQVGNDVVQQCHNVTHAMTNKPCNAPTRSLRIVFLPTRRGSQAGAQALNNTRTSHH
eukprot:4197551-Karenia_brevis.AAC.1